MIASSFCRQADPHKRALSEPTGLSAEAADLKQPVRLKKTLTGPAKLKERKDKIAEVAGRLFARQGYHGTSTH